MPHATRRRGSAAQIQFQDRATQAFQRFDLDGNGTLDKDEIAEMLQSLEKNVDLAMVQVTIERFTAGGERDLTLDDFIEVWRTVGVTL